MTFCFFLTAAPLALVEGALCSLIVCTSNNVNNRGLAWAQKVLIDRHSQHARPIELLLGQRQDLGAAVDERVGLADVSPCPKSADQGERHVLPESKGLAQAFDGEAGPFSVAPGHSQDQALEALIERGGLVLGRLA
jgi:hypothetical protein